MKHLNKIDTLTTFETVKKSLVKPFVCLIKADGGLKYSNAETDDEPIEVEQPNDEIWYTSTDSNIVTPNNSFTYESNKYSNGKGIIKCASDITEIGLCAFQECDTLKTVSIPKSVTTLGDSAFDSCTSLTDINLPADGSLTTLMNVVFMNCTSLRSITLPNTLTSIEENIFNLCSDIEIHYSGNLEGFPWWATNATLVTD